jgi:thioredoxin reductase (NADPH)
MSTIEPQEVLIIGGGLAGLSAAVYLGRSRRKTLLVHSNRSMAKWETDVQNYLGFPDGIDGNELLRRGEAQVKRFQVTMVEDDIHALHTDREGIFRATGQTGQYSALRVLIATGLTHLPPDIPGVKECLGKSLFFCKDCDAFRVQGQRIVIIGHSNEAADYALAMLLYSPSVVIATNGNRPRWDSAHAAWLGEYRIRIREERICKVDQTNGQLRALTFQQGDELVVDAVFTSRGDVYHSELAEGAGAALDSTGQILVDSDLKTTVPGLYAAGCLTPANCQMIIAAGQGATAAQAINRDLFEESLREHCLPRFSQPMSKKSES